MNCWDTLRAKHTTTDGVIQNVMVKKCLDWAISSQASQAWDEGSTTTGGDTTLSRNTGIASDHIERSIWMI